MPKVDRQAIYERDGGLCGFCGLPVTVAAFHLDHVQPRALGGLTTEENLRVAHRKCNITAGQQVRRERRRLGLPSLTPDSVKTVRFPSDLHERLSQIAEAEDRTLASLVIFATRQFATQWERVHGGGQGKP